MRVVQINPVCSGSTGKIAVEISKQLDGDGIENYILYAQGRSDFKNARKYATDLEIKINALLAKISGRYGFHSRRMTKRLIKILEEIKPDTVQLHNLHGHNVNLAMLFRYLKATNVKIFWTQHDCWSFTGYCTHFDYDKCNKWKTECSACPQRKRYSWFFDKSRSLFARKKELFSNLNLTVITPSVWLADLVRQSFLGAYPIKVIPNGIDLTLFKPTETDFRKTYNLSNKRIYLGVALGMGERKGFFHFLKLAGLLPEDTRLVLVGVSKEQIASLPKNVIGIERTANQKELAGIYTAADVFVNCTMEEVMGLVNVEALACGTPVVTFKTGGSPECIDETCGSVVAQGDVLAMAEAAKSLAAGNLGEKCRERAERFYDAEKRFIDYVNLYKG